MTQNVRKHDTIVVGGGQAGLATGYYLQKLDRDFVILDGNQQTGDPWRNRWDSLRVFTPAAHNGLPGMPFPAPPRYFPSKNEVADYMTTYADRFNLPIQSKTWVRRLEKGDEGFKLTANGKHFEARNVVVAMASYQVPWIPPFAKDLDPSIFQIHSRDYKNPSQLNDGAVLIVGAGNSGAEIAMEVGRHHKTWLAGRSVGAVPFRIDTTFGHLIGIPFVLRVLFHRILTVDTPLGRKVRPKLLGRGIVLVRVKPKDLKSIGIKRIPRITRVVHGLPVIDDGSPLEVSNVIWCTGFRPDFSWIKLPIFDGEVTSFEPKHERGVVIDVPGLYFVGLPFLYGMSSSILVGVGRDAKYVVNHIMKATKPARNNVKLEMVAS